MAATTVHDVPDHLLHRMFRLLDTHDSIVRAAAVCTRWRRLLSTRGRDMCWFRHDFTTCIGHFNAVDPSFSPGPKKNPSAAQRSRRVVFVPASPSISPRHFSLDFLPAGPDGHPWDLIDGSGNLLLLASHHRRSFFPDLVVCEPISRRFVRIPVVPGMKYHRCLGAFLDYRYNVITLSSFMVTCVLHDHADGMAGGVSKVTARVFNHYVPPMPPGHKWRSGWDVSLAACECFHIRGAESARYAGHASGYNFWAIEEDGTVLCHRISPGAFSHFRLPENVQGSTTTTFRFVENNRRVVLVSIVGDELRVFANQEYNYYAGATRVGAPEKPAAAGGDPWGAGAQGVLLRPHSQDCQFVTAGRAYEIRNGFVDIAPINEIRSDDYLTPAVITSTESIAVFPIDTGWKLVQCGPVDTTTTSLPTHSPVTSSPTPVGRGADEDDTASTTLKRCSSDYLSDDIAELKPICVAPASTLNDSPAWCSMQVHSSVTTE
ncbi:unnamed protein product [Urochloa humidicola]